MKYLVRPRILSYIKGRQKNCLRWYVDAAFAMHSDFKLHTEATLTMVKGKICIHVKKAQTE